MATLPIIVPSPTSGFHSSYYLGLGWGLAEVTWGIVQGWEQMSLYEDVMTPELDSGMGESKIQGLGLVDDSDGESGYTIQGMNEVDRQLEEEAELERKVEALERMRGRRGKLDNHINRNQLTCRSRRSHRYSIPSGSQPTLKYRKRELTTRTYHSHSTSSGALTHSSSTSV